MWGGDSLGLSCVYGCYSFSQHVCVLGRKKEKGTNWRCTWRSEENFRKEKLFQNPPANFCRGFISWCSHMVKSSCEGRWETYFSWLISSWRGKWPLSVRKDRIHTVQTVSNAAIPQLYDFIKATPRTCYKLLWIECIKYMKDCYFLMNSINYVFEHLEILFP